MPKGRRFYIQRCDLLVSEQAHPGNMDGIIRTGAVIPTSSGPANSIGCTATYKT